MFIGSLGWMICFANDFDAAAASARGNFSGFHGGGADPFRCDIME
jgi:hypothetical protein